MAERFDDDELERYARQIVLPEVGGRGQERLRAARVCLVGLGGLGCPLGLYLAAAGVGNLTLLDDDVVSLGNLHRQILFTDADVGRPKVDVAAGVLRRHAGRVAATPRRARLVPDRAAALLAGHDLVVDGSDNFATRLAVADAAAALGLPVVAGAVQGLAGQLTVLAPFATAAPCFRCLFPEAPSAGALPSCAADGVLGPVAGWIGAMMATEALKVLLGLTPTLVGTLLLVDAVAMRIDPVRVPRRPDCASAACRNRPRIPETANGTPKLAGKMSQQ